MFICEGCLKEKYDNWSVRRDHGTCEICNLVTNCHDIPSSQLKPKAKSYLLIENKGEIDVNALILMGGSTKRDSETAIGFFGSGNKYAVALMLRKKIGFRIFSGNTEWSIGTKPVDFRDKSFHQIVINGMDTSLTTDMGPQWDSWMGIREWVSNSIDEGEYNIMNSVQEIRSREGYTRIYIEHHPDILEVIQNWNMYFSFDREDCLLEANGAKVFPQLDHEKQSLIYYRKGIRCYKSATRALHNYDLPDFEINESRVLSDTHRGRALLTRFLTANMTKTVAANILANAFVLESGDHVERFLSYNAYMPGTGLHKAWREAIGDRIIVNNDTSGFYAKELNEHKHYRVSRQMALAIRNSFPDVKVYGVGKDDDDSPSWRETESTPKLAYLLKRSLDFLKETEFAVNYPVQIVEFDRADILGTIDRGTGTILLALKLFDAGVKEIVMTIMEEHIHLQTNLKDETRSFEQFLFRQWLSEKELRFGIFL